MQTTHAIRRVLPASMLFILLAGAALARSPGRAELRWFKGNTHTHTWYSDGDSAPEMAVKWYKEHGYNFLMLSDHNIMADHERWYLPNHKDPDKLAAIQKAAKDYEQIFGADWVERRANKSGQTEYRLKTLTEFRPLFEEAGRFLLIQGEEISDKFEGRPIHINGVNLKQPVMPKCGASMYEVMQNDIDAVLEQRTHTGQAMLPHLNHPNFGWACSVEDIMRLRGERLFEVHNGHPAVHDYGDAQHLSTERIWDILLTRRLTDLGLPVMYGLATDDAHCYTSWGARRANPGRGWVMVRARHLTPEHIVKALEQGDFYATTGVVLDDIRLDDDTLEIRIRARPGVSYKTQFIGTLKDYHDPRGSTSAPADRSNAEIGKILAEVPGTNPLYKLTGREIYVRAKVISDAKHPNPYREGDVEVAWVQPVQAEKQAEPN